MSAAHQAKKKSQMLAGGIVAASALIYAAVILPHQLRNRQMARKIESLTHEVDAARTVVQRGRELESQTSEARTALNGRLKDFTGRPMLEWLPEAARPYFERARLTDADLRPDDTKDEEGLPGFKRYSWKVEVALAREGDGMGRLLSAVADLTGENPFIKVADLQVQPDAANPAQLKGAMTLVVLDRAPVK